MYVLTIAKLRHIQAYATQKQGSLIAYKWNNQFNTTIYENGIPKINYDSDKDYYNSLFLISSVVNFKYFLITCPFKYQISNTL